MAESHVQAGKPCHWRMSSPDVTPEHRVERTTVHMGRVPVALKRYSERLLRTLWELCQEQHLEQCASFEAPRRLPYLQTGQFQHTDESYHRLQMVTAIRRLLANVEQFTFQL